MLFLICSFLYSPILRHGLIFIRPAQDSLFDLVLVLELALVVMACRSLSATGRACSSRRVYPELVEGEDNSKYRGTWFRERCVRQSLILREHLIDAYLMLEGRTLSACGSFPG